MWFAMLACLVVLAAFALAATIRRGRRTPYPTVEDRPAGRD